MGCDIHMFTEYKKTYLPEEEQKWQNCDHFTVEDEDEPTHPDGLELVDVYSGRNYNLFARLAGVRKYNDNIPTLSEPRGLPDDVSPTTRKWNEYWGADGHSHSYATYKELEEYQYLHAGDSLGFKEMMDAIKDRLKEIFWVHSDEKIEDKYKNNFRIVFWFDN